MALFPLNKDMFQIFKFHVNTHLNLNKVTNIIYFLYTLIYFFKENGKNRKRKTSNILTIWNINNGKVITYSFTVKCK